MKKTIVINATALGSKLNGISVYIRELLREVASIKTDIRFIVRLNETARCHFEKLRLPGNMVFKYSTRFLSPDYGFAGHLLRLLFSNLLPLMHPGLFCFNGSQLEAMFFKSRQVIMIHDIIPLLMKQDNKKQYYFFKYLLPRALRSAAAIVTPSAAVKDHLMQAYRLPDSKIHVIYHGVEHAAPDAAAAGSADNRPGILFVGRQNPHKNLARLLEGYRRVRDVVTHPLIIVGMQDRRSCRRSLGPEKVIFKGYVSEQEKFLLYRSALLLVFPSLLEGFGFPPLEAMANSCPVVASNSQCIPEICGDAVYYVNAEDSESIAEGMREVARNESVRNQLIRRGRDRAGMFSWRRSAERHAALFDAVLAREGDLHRRSSGHAGMESTPSPAGNNVGQRL